MSRSNMGSFRCIHTGNPSSPSRLNGVKVDLNGYCALIGYHTTGATESVVK